MICDLLIDFINARLPDLRIELEPMPPGIQEERGSPDALAA
jgi:hypothetical protein